MPLELSPEVKARIREIVSRYPKKQAALLPALHIVQSDLGYLSPDAQLAVAAELEVPPTLVREVVTFYEMYHEHPEGQFHLELCTNISCHLQGADALMDHLKSTLGVEVGHQTSDGMFSLMDAECLASCGSGPTMKVGLDYYEGLSIPAVDALLGRFRAACPSLQGKHYECGKGGPHTGPVLGFEPPTPESFKTTAKAPEPPHVVPAPGPGAVADTGSGKVPASPGHAPGEPTKAQDADDAQKGATSVVKSTGSVGDSLSDQKSDPGSSKSGA